MDNVQYMIIIVMKRVANSKGKLMPEWEVKDHECS